jgi:hypothetical protein
MFLAFSVLAGVAGQVSADRPATAKKRLDLAYITDDFFGAVVFHPQQIARSPVVLARLQEILGLRPMKAMPFDPLQLEQVLVLIPVPPQKRSGPDSDAPSFVLRFSADARRHHDGNPLPQPVRDRHADP